MVKPHHYHTSLGSRQVERTHCRTVRAAFSHGKSRKHPERLIPEEPEEKPSSHDSQNASRRLRVSSPARSL
ncbi:hypothetical protein EYF80_049823 [Liparis tanakae]|uniref:Uncharacterized protein n=1 Tax=Liparis tanakae TaxID=230148 RepID=A0A4Z2FGK1_9TELE|nr:hypothetical protein EYF80_049823 [Liparis tanakae]